MNEPKKLIEVAMPIKEISAESVTDVRIQHGHISSLHTWWARRPLPVSRAVVFASLVPDPLDLNCPSQFVEAVNYFLSKERNEIDYYKPYDDIPFTSALDKMEENPRNRLMMFIGKFSENFLKNEKQGKNTESKFQLSDKSLIKWENKNNNNILDIARKLIWVAFNANDGKSFKELIYEYDDLYGKIKTAENDYYNLIDRHIIDNKSNELLKKLEISIEEFQNKMPKVFDPFAGGGAIPLEASRLGCKSYGNDINPVAHIIQKGSLVYPQKFGKRISYSLTEFKNIYKHIKIEGIDNEIKIISNGALTGVNIPNRLLFDVEYFAKLLLKITEQKVSFLYPRSTTGKPIAYYWARTMTCSNPTCGSEIPILRQFYLTSKKDKEVYLKPIISGNSVDFEIQFGVTKMEGWSKRGNVKCPCCLSVTDVKTIKKQSVEKGLGHRLLAVIETCENGKIYRKPTTREIEIVKDVPEVEMPSEKMQRNSAGGDTFSWGINTWGQMFTKRQLFTMQTLVNSLDEIKNEITFFEEEYRNAIITYLAILIDRGATRLTSFGVWNPQYEKVQPIFSRQAIPMVFDYPESVFNAIDGPIASQLDWILKVIESESSNEFSTTIKNASSGEKLQFPEKYLTAVVTDPPYYDAIAYADLSDFFYVWLKRSLGSVFVDVFSTPQTPKSEECTALKHHHNDDKESAKEHFENKLLEIFQAIELQTKDIVSIMFAHQSTEAWTTLCNSIIGSKMNITGSWALDTEMTGALKTDKAFLSSSVTVACRPSIQSGIADFKDIREAVGKRVTKEVEVLYKLGFRGADLLTACFGQAVSEFGKYQKVEKADGNQVNVSELLEMARESAFNSLLKGFDGDDFTKFYIGWLQLNGFSQTEFDDAAKFTKVGLKINVNEIIKNHILILDGNSQHLASMKERINLNSRIGDSLNSYLIDKVHKLMFLYNSANRRILLSYINTNNLSVENPVWRVLTSLIELLPKGIEDHNLALGLLTNKDQLIRESKSTQTPNSEQSQLTFE